jgi:type VI secretion system protein ImpJ
MADYGKVVWFEGMTLDPHHFQQWDRYQQNALKSRIRAIAPYDWGLSELEIDRERLANGEFSVLRCRGVTSDGLPFQCPEQDPLPEARSFEEYFASTEERLGVFLALPVERPRGINCLLEGQDRKRETRYMMERITLPDDNTGTDERQIGVARVNLQLRFAGEPHEEYTTLKIAEIERTPEGGFGLSSRFIPPCLAVSAAENLATMGRRLLEMLVAKSTALLERRRQQPSGQIEYTTADVTVFWLLHTVNTFIPVLNHQLTTAKAHPESFYQTLLALAGQLTAFSADASVPPRDFPRYDHNSPSEPFGRLFAIIQGLLGEYVSRNYVSIPLEKARESLYVGRVGDDSLFEQAQFFLVGSGDFPERKLIEELPEKLRVASPETIDAVLKSLTRALGLSHTVHPPVGLPGRPGLLYFQLEKHGPFWDAICRSRALAIFIPAELTGLSLELVAVRQMS